MSASQSVSFNVIFLALKWIFLLLFSMNYIIHFTYIESINTQLLCGLIVPNSIAKCTKKVP